MSFRSFTLMALFLACSFVSRSQEYLGTWILDWTQVLDTARHNNPLVQSGLTLMEAKEGKNPLCILFADSLKVMSDGEVISAVAIKWKDESTFEILDPSKRKSPLHYIERVGPARIKMRTNYFDGALYFRKI